eukprot:1317944-Rhodomonas_salina.1
MAERPELLKLPDQVQRSTGHGIVNTLWYHGLIRLCRTTKHASALLRYRLPGTERGHVAGLCTALWWY